MVDTEVGWSPNWSRNWFKALLVRLKDVRKSSHQELTPLPHYREKFIEGIIQVFKRFSVVVAKNIMTKDKIAIQGVVFKEVVNEVYIKEAIVNEVVHFKGGKKRAKSEKRFEEKDDKFLLLCTIVRQIKNFRKSTWIRSVDYSG